jgi:hypothetical protein
MTVKDLIEKLQTLDPEAQVFADDGEFGPYDLTEVTAGYVRRDRYFVPRRRFETGKRPRTHRYRKAILLH